MPRYEIRVRGPLAAIWRPEFEGFEFAEEPTGNGQCDTVMTGRVVDQAALHGVLARIRDLGLELQVLRKLGAD